MSHPALSSADRTLASALAASARGPERNAVFALWLVVRAALGAAPPALAPARQVERLRAVAHRVRSLAAPAAMRRSLASALADLAPSRGTAPAVVLSHLVAPASENCPVAAAAIQAAARAARPGPPEPHR